MASDDTVREIKARVDIVAEVGTYVHLQRKGNTFWGLCPFHEEKTPSFSVDPARGFYYCFGCQRGGDVIKFVQNMEHLSFKETLLFLAKKYNIPVTFSRSRQESSLAGDLYALNEAAMQVFYRNLISSPEGKQGLAYLEKREISRDTVDTFSLGFALDSWDNLYHQMERRFSQEVLRASGLFRANPRGFLYDAYRKRVVFPIKDLHGRVVAFGGRIIEAAESTPKYINSPTTPVYKKGNLVYGLGLARKHINKRSGVVLVEGYMDMIRLFQAGIRNTVASLGTALTAGQINTLKRYTRLFYLAFDSDDAGLQSARNNFVALVEADTTPYHVPLAGCKDPDAFIARHGAEAFSAILEKAPPLAELVLSHFISLTKEQKSFDNEAFVRIIDNLLSIANGILRAELLSRVADALGTTEKLMFSEYKRLRGRGKGQHSSERAQQRITVPTGEIKYLKALMVMQEPERNELLAKQEYFLEPRSPLRDVVDWLLQQSGPADDVWQRAVAYAPDTVAGVLVKAEHAVRKLSAPGKQNLIKAVKQSLKRKLMQDMQQRIEQETDPGARDKLLQEKMRLHAKGLRYF